MRTSNRQHRRSAFTLIEILIVVIILGVLAGIVIPQFNDATSSSKSASVESTAHTLRAAVQLYYYQHNDTLPPPAQFWLLMTTQTDALGNPYAAGTSASGPFGPYMQSIPANALNQSSSVIDGNVAPGAAISTACGWEYDYASGLGNGTIHGTDKDMVTVLP